MILDAGNLFTSVFTQTHPLCGANLTSLYLADTVGLGKTCQQLPPTNSSEFISLQSRNTGENSFLNALQKYFLSHQIQFLETRLHFIHLCTFQHLAPSRSSINMRWMNKTLQVQACQTGTWFVLPWGHSLSGNSSSEPWKGKHDDSVILPVMFLPSF